MRWVSLLGLLFGLSAEASAADWYVESPSVEDRVDAVSWTKSLGGTKGAAPRVVRRYRHGVGWEYVVRIDGFANEAEAVAGAEVLAKATGRGASVYRSDGLVAEPIALPALAIVPEVQKAPASFVAVRAEPDAGAPEAKVVLERASKAWRGGPLLADVAAAPEVSFRFRRWVPSGPVVVHTFGRKGGDLYLDVAVESGQGTSSASGVVGDNAWMRVGKDAPVKRDTNRTRDALLPFAPERVLALVGELQAGLGKRADLTWMTTAGEADLDGHRCYVLRHAGDPKEAAVELLVDIEDHVIRRFAESSPTGEIVVQFDGWGLVGGHWLPTRARTWRGGTLVDDVAVVGLDLSPDLPPAWFQLPAATP